MDTHAPNDAASLPWLDRPAVVRSLLVLWCLALFFYGILRNDLYRTENLRVLVAKEMWERGNWIVPFFGGEPLFSKPPGMYVAILICSLPFGEVTELSGRIPSALAASACVLLYSWYFGRRLGPRAALVAGLMLPMSALWIDKASAAEIDMLQVMWVTASILFFLRATENEDSPSFGWWLAALLCMAGGLLTKWTAPEFFYGTAIPYLWFRGRLRLLLSWPHMVSAAIAFAAATAWIGAAIALEGWNQFVNTVANEALPRFIPTHYVRPYPWSDMAIHPIKLFITLLPWSGVALIALYPGFWRRLDDNERRLLLAMHCWVWPQVLFWTFPSDHSSRHSFPMFPGVMGMAVMVWLAWEQGKLAWRLPFTRPSYVLAASALLWLTAKIGYVEAVQPRRTATRGAREKGEAIANVIPPNETIYHFHRNKDEGILWYAGRPVRRLNSPEDLPAGDTAKYCVMSTEAFQEWRDDRPKIVLCSMNDETHQAMVVVRVDR